MPLIYKKDINLYYLSFFFLLKKQYDSMTVLPGVAPLRLHNAAV